MRILLSLFGTLAAIAVFLHIAPQVMDMSTTLIADMCAYFQWVIEGGPMGSDPYMLADEPIHQ